MIKIAKCLTVACALASVCGWTEVPADFTHDMAPLYRNVNTANSGLEQIMPFSVMAGIWFGDVPLSVNVSFRVFPAGRTNLLYASAPRPFTPPRPCTNPTSAWLDQYEPQWVALPGSPWTHQASELEVECTVAGGGAEIVDASVFVYSANLAAANGAVWTKVFNKRWLKAFQAIDTNGDGKLDALMLVLDFNNTLGGDNEQVVILNPTSGAVISNATYEFSRTKP